MVYGDYLYIGEYNDEEIALESVLFDIDFDFVNENLRQSVSLYRMDKDENIELVVGDPTPPGRWHLWYWLWLWSPGKSVYLEND